MGVQKLDKDFLVLPHMGIGLAFNNILSEYSIRSAFLLNLIRFSLRVI